jgi:hypothetical protein
MPLKNDYVSTGDPLTAAQLDTATTQINTNTTDIANLATNPISKTAAYIALPGDFVVCDASGGAFTVTLPTTPLNKTRVAVAKFDTSGNAVTVSIGGTDRFNVTGGPTTLSLTTQFTIAILHYNSTSGIWYVLSGKSPYLSNVDNTSDATKWAATKTLTNTRLTPRITSLTNSDATPDINVDITDQAILTALSTNITTLGSAFTGTPTDGQGLLVRIKDNGTARTIGYHTNIRALGVTLPTTTVISKTLYLGMKWNAADSLWDVLAVGQQA